MNEFGRQIGWQLLRIVLGILQMGGALAALLLLWRTGLSPMAVGFVMATCLATSLSVALFGSRPRRRE